MSRPTRPYRKLTLEQARMIRDSFEGDTVTARRFGVSRALVRKIRDGDCWPEVCKTKYEKRRSK